jgi:hypothetical protein
MMKSTARGLPARQDTRRHLIWRTRSAQSAPLIRASRTQDEQFGRIDRNRSPSISLYRDPTGLFPLRPAFFRILSDDREPRRSERQKEAVTRIGSEYGTFPMDGKGRRTYNPNRQEGRDSGEGRRSGRARSWPRYRVLPRILERL